MSPSFLRRRWLAVVGIVVVVGAAAMLVAARLLLDPEALKAAAQSRASAALGQPVAIGAIHFSLFPPISVVATDIGVGAAGGPSVDVGAVRMRVRLMSIFKRPIVIDRVEIDDFTVNARRDAAGRLVLPLPATTSAPATSSDSVSVDVSEIQIRNGRLAIAEAAAPSATRPVVPIDRLDGRVRHEPGVMQLEALTAAVGHSKVEGSGSLGADGLRLHLAWTGLQPSDAPLVFALVGTSAPAGLSVEGKRPLVLDLRVAAGGQISASGKVSADRASFGTLVMTAFGAPVAFAGNRLTLDPMVFRAYSGTGRAAVSANVAAPGLPWSLDANLQRVDIDQLVSANTTARHKISGVGSLNARLRGSSRAPIERTLAGSAALQITDGVIRDFPLVAALYSALKLGNSGGRDLQFQSLSGTFTIADARATTSDLLARTGEMTMKASGAIGFDQSLAMTGTAIFSAARSAEFVHSIRELSSLENGNGEIEVPFAVSGTAAAPHFSIDVASLLRRGLQNELKRRLGDKLKDIFKRIKRPSP